MSITADKILVEKDAKSLLLKTKIEADKALACGRDFKFFVDHSLFSIAYYTGLRISEMSDLNWGDVSEEYLIVRDGKGNKARTVFFGKKAHEKFEWIKKAKLELLHQPTGYDAPVFIGQRGRLRAIGIHHRTTFWFKRMGFTPGLSFHSFRHGYATRLLDQGVPLSAVKEQLGHSDIRTTALYLHFTSEAKEKIVGLT